ncbi:MAG: sporulation protein YqfD [Clostridia bacterium]|nr:sporulation protein YqfD [Clostridia bacterium]
MKGVLCRYEVKGCKTEYLLEWLHAENVKIYGAFHTENGIILTIEDKDCEKLFAISSNMCYNIKKIGYKGKFAPLKILCEKCGLAIGGIAFIVAAALADGVITDVDYRGEAAYFKKEIDAVLFSSGAGRLAVSEGDLKEAEREILVSSDEISFVTVKKSGHRLIVEAYRAKEEPPLKNLKKSVIVATLKGVVGKITVLGGRALVKEGDEVDVGDVLIDGRYSHADREGETYALGEVEIISEKIYEYEGIGEESAVRSRATLLASMEAEGEIISSECEIKEDGGKKICVVRTKYSVWVS